MTFDTITIILGAIFTLFTLCRSIVSCFAWSGEVTDKWCQKHQFSDITAITIIITAATLFTLGFLFCILKFTISIIQFIAYWTSSR